MDFSFFISQFLRRSPMILMALSGMAIALVRWKRHPKVSLRTLLSLGLYLLQSVVFTIIFYLVSTLFDQSSRWFYTGLYVVQDFFYAIMIILLVTAALSQRSTSPVITN